MPMPDVGFNGASSENHVKHVLFSDESTFTVFPTSMGVTIWRSPKQDYHLDCCMPKVKHRDGSVMGWAAISCHYLLCLMGQMPMTTEPFWRTMCA